MGEVEETQAGACTERGGELAGEEVVGDIGESKIGTTSYEGDAARDVIGGELKRNRAGGAVGRGRKDIGG